jgi:hypothetical protein
MTSIFYFNCFQDNAKLMKENVELIKQINEHRRDIKSLEKEALKMKSKIKYFN